MDLFFLTALLGPLLAGLAATALGHPWWWGAVPFVLYFGLWGLVHDWFVLDQPEDRVFHVVLTLVMVGLAALGGLTGRRWVSRRRPSSRRPAGTAP